MYFLRRYAALAPTLAIGSKNQPTGLRAVYEERVATHKTDSPLRESVAHSDTTVRSSRRRSRSHSSRSNSRKVLLLQVALVVTIAVAFVGGSAGLMYIQKLSRENDQLFFTARKQQKELTESEVVIKELMSERDSLVEGRIPGLKEIAYDETFEVDAGYVRNIIFTLTRAKGKNTYEYKLVLANQTLDVIKPRVYVRFYDELGTQVGGADIGATPSTDSYNPEPIDPDQDVLKPDEIRSYSDKLDVVEGAVPRYFTVIAH